MVSQMEKVPSFLRLNNILLHIILFITFINIYTLLLKRNWIIFPPVTLPSIQEGLGEYLN